MTSRIRNAYDIRVEEGVITPEPAQAALIGALDLRLSVDGEVKQDSNTRHLVLDVPGLIAWASSMYTLMPGDIIMTGTPAGVGAVQPGAVLQAGIAGIGEASVRVANHYG